MQVDDMKRTMAQDVQMSTLVNSQSAITLAELVLASCLISMLHPLSKRKRADHHSTNLVYYHQYLLIS